MANKDDYLTEYRQFFEEFANTVEPNDQLPVKLGSYKFLNSEVVGGIIDWCLQYLNRKSCPSTLVGPLIKITIDEIRNGCKKNPLAYGFNPNENVYEPLKLMQTVMSKVNEICLQYLDNSRLDTLPTPPSISPSKVSVCATRNTRRRMEDRHVVIHDMNSMFNIPDTSLASYYAIFDGHAGPDAAAYSAAHLHQFLVESEFYPTDPERALKDAFLRTDEFFLEKSKVESFRSGTTAVCALLRPKEETLYVAWVGDSQALLVNRGKVLQIVKPHKPSREDEKDRIEANGGCVIYWGMWRVNGQLAVSRAIGDLKLKPYVTAEPDIVAVPLDGNEEFLIMACDGLWDFVSEDDAAINVYNRIKKNPENIDSIAESLAELAKQEGSRDNISIIIIFLKDPSKIAKKLSTDWGWPCAKTTDAAMETGVDNQINNASNNFDLFDVFQKRGTLFNDETDFKSNGTEAKQTDLFLFERPANGKRPASEFEDDDLGPETNIDSLENITVDSDKIVEKMAEEIVDNNDKKMDELMDFEVQNQKLGGFETIGEVREETPTPPVDSVLDSSGVADNVAESEESEDEWNYYRVDPKEKESSSPTEETNKDICDPTDEMSQLNPDAKEFVPVSPTRSTESPAPYPRDLVDDTLIAQSPRRAIPMDINVPSAVEFQFEVKQRPSELFDEFKEEQNEHQLSSQEIMQNLLNGKDVSEIEFHPQNVIDSSPDDIIENNLIETDNNKKDISEENQSTTEVTENFIPKIQTQDPMSMSFYQDKDEEATSDSNPFDLNKVQVLPENVDEFIQQTNKIEAEISPAQSPLGVPLAKTPVSESPLPKSDIIEENRSPLGVPLAKTPVSESPLSKPDTIEENRSPLGIPLAKTPVSDSPLPKTDTIEENKSLVEIANSPICDIVESVEKLATPEIIEEILVDVTPKPLEVHSPENSPMGPLSPKSPIPELTGLVSPDITASIKDENISGESPLLEELITEKPTEEITQNVVQQAVEDLIEQTADLVNQIKDDLQIKDTQVEELISDAIQDIPQTVPEKMSEEIVAATSEFILELNSEPILEQIAPQLSEQICNTSTVYSEVVNEFLERSEIPEVTSPLSPSEEIEKFQTEPPENWKQNLEIQCETIKPEFAVHTIASPSEESTPPPPTPVAISTEPQKIVEAETKTQKVTSKPLSAKKPLTKPSTPIASTAAKKTPIKTTTLKSRTSTTPSASPKTTTASKTTPRVSAITQVNKEATKKLTNGDVKPKTTLIKKTTPNLTATKTVAEKKPATATTARTTTSKLTTTSRPLSATAAPKPRPAPAKITSTSATTKTAPSRPTTIPAARPAPITAKPKPLPSTTVPKPRVASAKTATKTPDAEKQQKDTVNKQLSASRTTKTTTARTATLAPKKPDVKTSTTTRTTTRTSTTTSKSAIKRPEVTKTTITKTKTTSSKATAEQNGVNIVKEITTTIEEPQLLKDHSPIEVDNSKIEEIIAD